MCLSPAVVSLCIKIVTCQSKTFGFSTRHEQSVLEIDNGKYNCVLPQHFCFQARIIQVISMPRGSFDFCEEDVMSRHHISTQ